MRPADQAAPPYGSVRQCLRRAPSADRCAMAAAVVVVETAATLPPAALAFDPQVIQPAAIHALHQLLDIELPSAWRRLSRRIWRGGAASDTLHDGAPRNESGSGSRSEYWVHNNGFSAFSRGP